MRMGAVTTLLEVPRWNAPDECYLGSSRQIRSPAFHLLYATTSFHHRLACVDIFGFSAAITSGMAEAVGTLRLVQCQSEGLGMHILLFAVAVGKKRAGSSFGPLHCIVLRPFGRWLAYTAQLNESPASSSSRLLASCR